jgi:predicted CXXCH cytochrome family protein
MPFTNSSDGGRGGDRFALVAKSVAVFRRMDRCAHGSPIRPPDRPTLILLAALAALLSSPAGATWAPETTEHPFIEPQDIRSETCLTCHPAKREGKFVHSAVTKGCENCHQAASQNGKTTITLIAIGGELCAICHKVENAPVMHDPYENGLCMICHDPHTSNFPRQARAEANMLCLSCHGVNQPDVKIDEDMQVVSMLGGRTVSFADYRQAPKIGLDRSGIHGHPVAGHPVAGKDPRRKGATLSCLSCHVPHSSAIANLLPHDAKSDTGLCAECHKQGE